MRERVEGEKTVEKDDNSGGSSGGDWIVKSVFFVIECF